ncbi:hypothetical protein BS50DRAFT_630245 [Corynespora cassiicola Philippines]|uniref:Nuclear pore complex protein An-Nup82 n=1 Tax=Corynespora cassiicola Philippines TaxID=1448308 RepID=A0A2T2P3C7_CORCC|nr:hypothetical protein BS50DRAFT_630245 [Corynespora cassiicola Philippines]
MPKVLSYTPQWLQRPNPGYHIFAPKAVAPNALVPKKRQEDENIHRKTIATRGSEIFVAVGHEIRWADLAALKEETASSYRTLKVSIPLPITRLTLSPYGDYLAVSTSHTVHVVHLPDSSTLAADDNTTIKPKTFQVGPTAHVLEESPVASILWHPLGYHGRCLITITRAGVVRLWEVNRSDRSTFSEPTLSIDIQKLANATCEQDDLSASKYGAPKGFSPDSVELEVASACFGDFPEQEGVHGWAPLTLWIAMIGGDVYALCPLLPSKWQLFESTGATTFLQTLTSSVNINHAEIEEDEEAPDDVKEVAQKQLSWLSDILYQEPFKEQHHDGDSVKVFTRPGSVPAIPLLQGPFNIAPEVDEFELSDIVVYSLKTFFEGTDEEAAEGLPAAVICLLTDTCKVHICLDLEGVEGRWLPSVKYHEPYQLPDWTLYVAETVVLRDDDKPSFNQCITPDVHTDFSFFVSDASGVFYVSLESWIRKLENELSEPQQEGAGFRLKRLLDSASTHAEKCIQGRPRNEPDQEDVTAAVIIEDGNIGYLLLTSIDDEPHAVILDAPEDGVPTAEEIAEWWTVPGPARTTRQPWRPRKELYEPIDLHAAIDRIVPARHKATFKDEIRLSPANLELLLGAHKVLAHHTHRLQTAVADLFNQCERLRQEFRDQIYRTAQLVPKIDSATGSDEVDAGSGARINARVEERLERVKTRQEEINARYENLRRKMAMVGGTELSEREAAWLDELQLLGSALDKNQRTLTDDIDGSEVPAWKRIETLKSKKQTIEEQIQELRKGNEEQERTPAAVRVPAHSRKQENEQVEALLQQEAALVEAATNKLRSLGVSIPVHSENGD